MKAWICRDRNGATDLAVVVFAETAGKAKSLAQCTEVCEDVAFIDIQCHRCPKADNDHGDKAILDWYDNEDRLILVRDCGFYCSYEMLFSDCNCAECNARKYCSRYESNMSENPTG